MSGVTVQAGLCAGNSQEVMLCVINESELEYTLERGLPLAEAHDWITRPAPALREVVALSAEGRRDMAPAPSDSSKPPVLTAAEASRILSTAVTAFGANEPDGADNSDGLDLTAIGLIPGERIPPARGELSGSPRSPGLSSSSHPNAESVGASSLGVMIPMEAPRREALAELNERLRTSALKKRWWSSLWLLTKNGRGPVEFDLPQASGDSFVLFDSDDASA